MLAAGARRLQTVISIRVQPTEDLPTTLHLSTDSHKSTKIQKNKREKTKKKTINQASKRRIKRLNETKQTNSIRGDIHY